MFRKLLIANRGEVAVRILRTCKRMGIQTVAVVSDADMNAQWLSDADEVVRIGAAKAAASYLNQNAILEVGRHTGCSAVHPGWGFLSENHIFAQRCEGQGMSFVGPAPRHLIEMGDKARARATMQGLGIPVIPGSEGCLATVAEARILADSMGYPVLLKAVAGGGGRGMRVARDQSEIESAFQEAAAEARACFGDDSLYMEKLIENGRHIEIQVLADAFGNCVHLGERECSLQRRHQKVIEEAPSPGLPEAERQRILPLIAEAIGRMGYRNAGTVEMLLSREGRLYFMEMNTRLQVEHSVTEQNTGIDLVEWQLRIAANQRLGFEQKDIHIGAHSIEFRVNAEDPNEGFRPSPGKVNVLRFPEGDGVRIDSHLKANDVISPHYDSMLAKLIVTGDTREIAMSRARKSLKEFKIEGVKTNLSLHRWALDWGPFVTGEYDIGSLEKDFRRA